MELLQLKYFLELAKKEHLTEVSESMYVSPPAVSNSISRLEEELGLQLFDRKGRRIYLNPYGKIYYAYAKRALDALEDGRRQLEEVKNRKDARVIAAAHHPILWQDVIQTFQEENPSVQVEIRDCSRNDGDENQCFYEEADLVLASRREFQDPCWDVQELFRDKTAIAVASDHALAEKKSIFLEEAKEEFFVCLPPSPFSSFCEEMCRQAGFRMKSRITCESSLRPDLAMYEKMAVLTFEQCGELPLYQAMRVIPLKDKDTEWDACVFWKKQRYLSKGAAMLKDFLAEWYAGRRN